MTAFFIVATAPRSSFLLPSARARLSSSPPGLKITKSFALPGRGAGSILVAMTTSRIALLDLPTRIALGLAGLRRTVEALSVGFVRDWTLGIWMVTWKGDIQGTLRHDGTQWCLDWLEAADPRLAAWSIPHPGASIDDIRAGLVRHIADVRLPASEESLRIEPILVF